MPHIHELYDFAVSIFVVYKDKVLLVHHPRYQKWLNVGGHVELDEDPEQTIYREVAEETGLKVRLLTDKPAYEDSTVKALPTPNYMDSHEANAPHRHIGLVYFCVAENNNAQLSDEHLDMRWLSDADLDAPEYHLSESLKFYAREALKLANKH